MCPFQCPSVSLPEPLSLCLYLNFPLSLLPHLPACLCTTSPYLSTFPCLVNGRGLGAGLCLKVLTLQTAGLQQVCPPGLDPPTSLPDSQMDPLSRATFKRFLLDLLHYCFWVFWVFFNLIFSLAALGLHCCTQVFSSYGEQRLLSSAAGFSCCCAQKLDRRLSSCDAWP